MPSRSTIEGRLARAAVDSFSLSLGVRCLLLTRDGKALYAQSPQGGGLRLLRAPARLAPAHRAALPRSTPRACSPRSASAGAILTSVRWGSPSAPRRSLRAAGPRRRSSPVPCASRRPTTSSGLTVHASPPSRVRYAAPSRYSTAKSPSAGQMSSPAALSRAPSATPTGYRSASRVSAVYSTSDDQRRES